MSGAIVRRAGTGDLDGLVRLENEAFTSDQLDRRAFRHALGSPSMDALVAVNGAALLGYALLQRRRGSGVARLTSVAVGPDAHGQGLGRRLVEAAERTAKEVGCRILRLEVRADNKRARALYERLGFGLIDTIEDYYEDGEAALKFEKALG